MEIQIKTPAQQLWYDYNNGRYFRIEADEGKQTQVEKDGSFLRMINPDVTGKASYSTRQQLSKSQNRGLAARIPKALFEPLKNAYTPQQDKLDGYSQCPRPVALPYENNIDYNLKVSTLRIKKLQNKTLQNMKSLVDNRNKAVGDMKTSQQSSLKHLSGTKTAYLLNVQNYRDMLLGSINKHLVQQDKEEDKIEDDKYVEIDPHLVAKNQKLAKNRNKIERLRKTIQDNQSGRVVHGRFLSQPPFSIKEEEYQDHMTSSPPRSTKVTQINSAFDQSRASVNRPMTSFTHFGANTSNSWMLNNSQSKGVDDTFNIQRSITGRSQANQTFNMNQSLISGFEIQKHPLMQGYSSLKERYKGTLIKSFLDEAKGRQNLSFNEAPIDEMVNPVSDYDDTHSFTRVNPRKTGQNFFVQMKQKELDMSVSLPKKEKEYRAKTKGRFAGIQINSPALNFIKDKQWQNRANAVASQAERKYLDRDKYLLEKRRYQRILKEIQCEEAAGIKGVTKMPTQYIKKNQ